MPGCNISGSPMPELLASSGRYGMPCLIANCELANARGVWVATSCPRMAFSRRPSCQLRSMALSTPTSGYCDPATNPIPNVYSHHSNEPTRLNIAPVRIRFAASFFFWGSCTCVSGTLQLQVHSMMDLLNSRHCRESHKVATLANRVSQPGKS